MQNRSMMLASLLLAILTTSPAQAAIAPGTIKRMKAEADSVLIVEVTDVTTGRARAARGGDPLEVAMQQVELTAKVASVDRSKSNVAAGDTITIAYQRTDAPLIGPKQPPRLASGWRGRVWLSKPKRTRTGQSFGLAVYGHSFEALPTAAAQTKPAQDASKMTANANAQFAIDLYKKLAEENAGENLFFSPYSVSSALMMTLEGARGETALEMGTVLGLSDEMRRQGDDATALPWQTETIHRGFNSINAALHSDPNDPALAAKRKELAELRNAFAAAKEKTAAAQRARDWKKMQTATDAERTLAKKVNALAASIDQFELNVANALWAEKTYRIEDDFRKTITQYYDTGAIAPADFKNDFKNERLRINRWVEDRTRDRIKNLIPEDGLNDLTRLVLVNAIYFKGDWAAPFKEEATKDQPFVTATGRKINAATMHATNFEDGRYAAFTGNGDFFNTPRRIGFGDKTPTYPDDKGFAIAELPYKGKELSMVLIAPMKPNGLANVESKLTAANLDTWLGKLEAWKMNVKLPRFKMETKYDLHETLQSMGMTRAFTDPRDPNGADFTGIHSTEDRRQRVYISKVFHKAFVEVNEKGTEAAAATAVVMVGATSAPVTRPFIPDFNTDRPFLLVIRHNETGAILFMGRVNDPTAK